MKSKIITIILGFVFLNLTYAQENINFLIERQNRLFSFLNVNDALLLIKDTTDIKIGVIETGFDFYHPDLKNVFIPGYYADNALHSEIYGNISHGTLVAGIIGANDSGTGIKGLVPHCKILTASTGTIENIVLKIQNELKKQNPNYSIADLQKEMIKNKNQIADFGKKWTTFQAISFYESVRFLVDKGIKVINYSSFTEKSNSLPPEAVSYFQKGFEYAFQNNVVMVVASGNSDREIMEYFGSSENIIVVGASTFRDGRWSEEIDYKGKMIKQGSCYGNGLTVVAPADSIVVCIPSDPRYYSAKDSPTGSFSDNYKENYKLMTHGATSCAAPIVTSLVALIYSIRPDLDCRSVIGYIKKGCDDIGEPGFDIYTGYGRINFFKTLKLVENDK